MKLSHLSLAILSAIALAACGGSGSDDHTTDPNANKPGATDQTPKQPEDKKDEDKKEDTAKDDAKIVDPTGDQVVDNISLAKDPTTASQQYIRGEKSSFDRTANPSEPASATVLSGITLDVQNPQLTNIVIGRIQGKNKENKDVNVALFAGSPDSKMESVGGLPGVSLQSENEANALVGDKTSLAVKQNSLFGLTNSGKDGFIKGEFKTIAQNPILGNITSGINITHNPSNYNANLFQEYAYTYKRLVSAYYEYNRAQEEYLDKSNESKKASKKIKAIKGGSASVNAFKDAIKYLDDSVKSYTDVINKIIKDSAFVKKYGIKFDSDKEKTDITIVSDSSKIDDNTVGDGNIPTAAGSVVKVIPAPISAETLNKYGAQLAWITTDGNFPTSNVGWGDYVENGKVIGVTADDNSHNGADEVTAGLVGIYRDSNSKKMVVRGSEDNNVRTTRIFGHYYRDPGSVDNLNITLNPEGYNSWAGARTFITKVDNNGVPNMYGLGVAPMTLNHVQYGRVTANINPMQLADRAESTTWVKERQDFANRDPEYKTAADNFYFYRGTDATTIKEMGALPTDTSIAYRGHALMYGVDNSFHGARLNLPNAFGNEESYGIGSFVKANLNMGSKKFDGYIYNVWASKDSAAVKEDKLVEFSGDVTGNTVIGTANLAYDHSKTGDLRASFYGSAANEVGGAIDSVKRQDPYGPVGWGGVFGAQRESVGGVSSAWLTSSEKK